MAAIPGGGLANINIVRALNTTEIKKGGGGHGGGGGGHGGEGSDSSGTSSSSSGSHGSSSGGGHSDGAILRDNNALLGVVMLVAGAALFWGEM